MMLTDLARSDCATDGNNKEGKGKNVREIAESRRISGECRRMNAENMVHDIIYMSLPFVLNFQHSKFNKN